jgi:hypothetical protein
VTRDDIIRLAQQIGYTEEWVTNTPNWLFIVKFAALVAAEERKKCIEIVLSRVDIDRVGVADAIRARKET